jgi:hypothetical protein
MAFVDSNFVAWPTGNRSSGLNVGSRIAAGLTTGALAVLLAQPTDVVKVRFQAQQRAVGTETVPRYKSTLQAYQTIARLEGARGLWKGELHCICTYKNINDSSAKVFRQITCDVKSFIDLDVHLLHIQIYFCRNMAI